MKNENRLRYYLLLFAMGLTLASCQKEMKEPISPDEEMLSVSEKVTVPESEIFSASVGARENSMECNTYYGPEVQMGKGHARSWINMPRKDGKPLAIGIEFTGKSFRNLPTDPLNFGANTFFLKLHQKAKSATPFDHIMVNWEPQGHEPPGIYDVPHFDMHFYKITLAQQLAITGVPGAAPPPGFLPASYVIQGATVPQMGTH